MTATAGGVARENGGKVIAWAIVGGFGMSALGTSPWALISWANLNYLPSVPWSAPIVAAHLWLFWRYAGGAGWPARTSSWRRLNRRRIPSRATSAGESQAPV